MKNSEEGIEAPWLDIYSHISNMITKTVPIITKIPKIYVKKGDLLVQLHQSLWLILLTNISKFARWSNERTLTDKTESKTVQRSEQKKVQQEGVEIKKKTEKENKGTAENQKHK